MSTHKYLERICVAALLITLLLTALFLNGRSLGLTPIVDGDTGDGQFTANDLDGDWDAAGATVVGLDDGSVEGDGAYWYDGDLHILAAGRYVLSGTLEGGSVVVDAGKSDKVWLLLNGVTLRCDDNAALLVEQAEKVFLTLAPETVNTVACGAAYQEDAVSAGVDGAIYARDDLTVNGSGALRVTADYRHAVVCNDDLVIAGGDIALTAAQDGIHANDSVRLTGMRLTIQAGDDGVTVSNDDGTGYLYVASGSVDIPACYEGLEAQEITVAGGTLDIRPTDDGINANGDGKAVLRISGGDVTIVNENGRDADGLDSNGSIYVSGGRIFISMNGSGGNCAIDCGTENGGVCEISGGVVVAAGGSAMAEGFDAASPQAFLMRSVSAEAGSLVTLAAADETPLFSETIPCGFTSLLLSAPTLAVGDVCTLTVGDAAETVTIDSTAATAGFGRGGFGRNGFDRNNFGAGDLGTDEPGTRPERRMREDGAMPPDWPQPFGEEGTASPDRLQPSGEEGITPPDWPQPSGEEGTAPPERLQPSGEEGIALPDRLQPSGEDGTAPPERLQPSGEEGTAPPERLQPSGEDGITPPDRVQPSGEEGAAQKAMRQPFGNGVRGGAPQRQMQASLAGILLPVGGSALLLLAGLLIAWRVKH